MRIGSWLVCGWGRGRPTVALVVFEPTGGLGDHGDDEGVSLCGNLMTWEPDGVESLKL